VADQDTAAPTASPTPSHAVSSTTSASAAHGSTTSTTAASVAATTDKESDGTDDPRWKRKPNVGCTNWALISMGDPTRQTTVKDCGELCLGTKSCVGFGYQPGTCRVAETGGESLQGGCYLWNGSCSTDTNECWDEYTLAGASSSAPPGETTTAVKGDEEATGTEEEFPTVGGDGGLPPWWILNNVEPAGEKDMGSWTAVTFSPEQQAQYGVDETGEGVNQTQFDLAIAATAPARATATPHRSKHDIGPAFSTRSLGRPIAAGDRTPKRDTLLTGATRTSRCTPSWQRVRSPAVP